MCATQDKRKTSQRKIVHRVFYEPGVSVLRWGENEYGVRTLVWEFIWAELFVSEKCQLHAATLFKLLSLASNVDCIWEIRVQTLFGRDFKVLCSLCQQKGLWMKKSGCTLAHNQRCYSFPQRLNLPSPEIFFKHLWASFLCIISKEKPKESTCFQNQSTEPRSLAAHQLLEKRAQNACLGWGNFLVQRWFTTNIAEGRKERGEERETAGRTFLEVWLSIAIWHANHTLIFPGKWIIIAAENSSATTKSHAAVLITWLLDDP